MKRLFLDIILVIVPVLSILVSTNFFVDPAHIFSTKYYDIAVNALSENYNITNVENCNERRLKRMLIESKKGNHYDYLIFGSSRCMQISTTMTGKSILNLGLSGATIEDLLALKEICFENEISFNKIILSIDPSLLNGNSNDDRWKENEYYYNKIVGIENKSNKWQFLSTISNLVSFSYFQTSLEYLCFKERSMIKTKSELNQTTTWMPDGAMRYGSVFSDRPIQDVKEEILFGELRQAEFNYESLSMSKIELFKLFIDSAIRDGKEIVFMTFPYPDLQYKRLISINGIIKQDEFIRDFAKSKKIKYFFCLCPDYYDITDNDFLDTGHLKWTSVKKLLLNYNVLY